MGYSSEVYGYISMSKDIFDDLMGKELDYNMSELLSVENGKLNFIDVPKKVMLKDYLPGLCYEDGKMKIRVEDESIDYGMNTDTLEGIFKSVSSKLDKDDMGCVEFFDEGSIWFYYWIGQDKVEYGEWGRPKDPDWFKEQ
jgi:hypothetical protein